MASAALYLGRRDNVVLRRCTVVLVHRVYKSNSAGGAGNAYGRSAVCRHRLMVVWLELKQHSELRSKGSGSTATHRIKSISPICSHYYLMISLWSHTDHGILDKDMVSSCL